MFLYFTDDFCHSYNGIPILPKISWFTPKILGMVETMLLRIVILSGIYMGNHALHIVAIASKSY